ncbi:hypothetical protein I316_02227 [Kwoniella heveanensis BCC8398]|uniref:NAD-dependent epimerase/dehydratase domain-containing protein n=1 Tax=Kwoniella heveanensis BCC8398 TaxID=1296120 RepID=A0A1B9GXH2_9TREE|nr:hypothetical protein I316_02227 [Kwoniella heveanensis BCC8398]
MHVFVTGGSGFIGTHTIKELIDHGHQVTAIARSDASAKTLEELGAKVVRATLEDTDVLFEHAKASDAVIHLAYIHDFADYSGRPARVDENAVTTFGRALQGTNKPLVTTTGVLTYTIDGDEDTAKTSGHRGRAEAIAFSFADKGVRPISIRLGASVHGAGDHGFVPVLIQKAKEAGYVGYPGDGSTRWPPIHVDDAATLYRLAIEKDIPGATALHAIAEPAVSQKALAEVIGKKLGLPLKSLNANETKAYYGWLEFFVTLDGELKSQKTRDITGWQPRGKTLLEDLESGTYFD